MKTRSPNRFIPLLGGLSLCALLLPALAVAADSCARISTFDIAPRTEKLFPAVLIEVDGGLPGPTSAETWRLSPGKHTLKVAEAIASYEFNAVQLRQRDGRQLNRYKTLDIVAEPGITYRLSAKLIMDKRHKIRTGEYWQPVIWKESPEPCH